METPLLATTLVRADRLRSFQTRSASPTGWFGQSLRIDACTSEMRDVAPVVMVGTVSSLRFESRWRPKGRIALPKCPVIRS
jgi:hypothetical protein